MKHWDADGRPRSEIGVVRLALELGAEEVGGPLSSQELDIAAKARDLPPPARTRVATTRLAIKGGEDPLGDYLCGLRPLASRRGAGAIYTPKELIVPMVEWALRHGPQRLVDPGCGSGRYAVTGALLKPSLSLIAVDTDPIATLLTRGGFAALKARRATVLNCDFVTLELPRVDGVTAYVGNPPYVRHHRVSQAHKGWLIKAGADHKQPAISTRAGLHAYFFFAVARNARFGDVGCLLTASEWLDTRYGVSVRSLLMDGLGAVSLHRVDPAVKTFDAVDTTGLITCFRVGAAEETIGFRQVGAVGELSDLTIGPRLARELFQPSDKWTPLLTSRDRTLRQGYRRVKLGTVARIRRGIATGANDFFVMTPAEAKARGLAKWSVPVISRAAEIFLSGGTIRSTDPKKLLLSPDKDTKRLKHPRLNSYLMRGERATGDEARVKDRHLCGQRDPWWCVERPTPAPIVVTYMGRRAPAFAANPDGVALLNIGHYLYPRSPAIDATELVRVLNEQSDHLVGLGRTYQGGLEKFEPGDLAALEVDVPEHIAVLLETGSS